MKLKEKLKEFTVDGDFDYQKLKDNISKWPEIINDNGKVSKLNMDDFQFIKLTEKSLVIKCSSLYHPPYKIKIKINDKNNLEIYECRLSDFGIEDYININNILK